MRVYFYGALFARYFIRRFRVRHVTDNIVLTRGNSFWTIFSENDYYSIQTISGIILGLIYALPLRVRSYVDHYRREKLFNRL